MKVTTLQDLEDYIYSSVILPLKGLVVDDIFNQSPIMARDGREVSFQLSKEHIVGDFEHNFQRNAARDSAKTVVILSAGRAQAIVADYDHKTNNVRIYAKAFTNAKFEGSLLLMNKLIHAFSCYTPFNKVDVVKDKNREIQVYVATEIIGLG